MSQFNELLHNFDTNTTVLTGSRRLARSLRIAYDFHQQQQGKIVWQSIDILPWTTWVERCWQSLAADGRIILSEFHEQLLWEKIIRETANNSLTQVFTIAVAAKEAWGLLQQWNLTLTDLHNFTDETTQTFIAWANNFHKTCITQGWLERASLVNELTKAIANKRIKLPPRILLVGFDLLTPQQQQLFDTLGQLTHVERFESQKQSATQIYTLGLPDTQQEIYAMASWAYQQWQTNSELRIGCVVPELSNLRDSVEQIFTEIFKPTALLPGNTSKTHLPFNISAGKRLVDYPLIREALRALSLNVKETDMLTLSELLRSPFIGDSVQELSQRAALDLKLRANLIKNPVSLHDTFAFAQQQDAAWFCPSWVRHARAFLREINAINQQQMPSQWAKIFQRQLASLGWPGERTLNSPEYQIVQRWQTLLDEFATLDWLVGRISLRNATQHLNHLASSIIFQPESPPAAIQILGIYEATHLDFNRLWVMGLSDDIWPGGLAPNPLLPIHLQRRLAMPKANVEHELGFYQQLTQQFASSAQQVIFSYPQQNQDFALRPSPLISAYPKLSLEALNLQWHSPMQVIAQQRLIENWVDDIAPTVTPYEKIKGGADILRHQAACPLRAFAKCRLHTQAIPEPQFGLDNQQRGKLVHAVLTNVWEKIQNYTQLQRYSDDELQSIVIAAVSAALEQLARQHILVLAPYSKRLEEQRLQKLILEWLTVEKQRAPFNVIAHEQKQEILLAGLALQLRLDRIDELSDGSRIIIDYKTSTNVTVNDWFGDRPEAPQMPLYAVINSTKINGLLYAQVRAGNMQFKGIMQHANSQLIAKKNLQNRDDWPELLNEWREKLLQLAQNFCAGKAEVDPKEADKTCSYCDLPILCRIKHLTNKF